MDSLKNEFGFTLISMLIALSLFAFAAPFLSHSLKSAQFSSLYEELSVEQFFLFIRDELALSSSKAIQNNVLHYETYSNADEWSKATLKLLNNRIIREINGGYEVYLFDVDSINFTNLNDGVEIKLVTLDGNSYRKRIRFYE